MIGTAIQDQPFDLFACVRRSSLWTGSIRSSVRERRSASRTKGLSSFFSVRRRLVTAVVLLAFVLGSAVCGPAAHQWLEGDSVASAPTVEATKAPAKHTGPSKSAPATCTGHCASHTMSLPAQIVASDVPYIERTGWSVLNDQWSEASRPARLERPPRV
jgi:hypothetical protein